MKTRIQLLILTLLMSLAAHTQVNSGSNGSDGAFNPTTNTVINMADHPTGIYHYTSVNIPTNVTVTFIPNANNTPVVWLVQSNVVIDGTVNVRGETTTSSQGGLGGPGGYLGGNGGVQASYGQGPGGGSVGYLGGNGSYGTIGASPAGSTYGNAFLIPLLGGSGGGGSTNSNGGGGGGGGAILIAASDAIQVNGYVGAEGGGSPFSDGGGGSGGGVRFVASRVFGSGIIGASGGYAARSFGSHAGSGRIRFDTYENTFAGLILGAYSQGFQPIIIPTNGQAAQLTVMSVGGVPVSASPTGALSTPDAVLSAQQNNPIPIVVHCSNIPLNTQITVSVKPANGAAVSATGLNSSGSLSSSTATVLLNMPRGGGIIYATAATGN